jgi:hypothetical protein
MTTESWETPNKAAGPERLVEEATRVVRAGLPRRAQEMRRT